MKKLTPVKAIRAKCIDCSNGQNNEIRACQIVKCPLWPYRMGHRPKNTNENSPILENNVVNGEYIEK